MKDRKDEILDSEDELTWSWIRGLSPQDGKAYILARAAARAGRANIYRDEAKTEKIASDMFGGKEVGNFNLWLEPPNVSGASEDEDTSESHSLEAEAGNVAQAGNETEAGNEAEAGNEPEAGNG